MLQFYSKSNSGTVWNLRRPETELMRIPDHAIKSVVFLCVKTTNGKNKEKFLIGGTAFFVGIPFEGEPSSTCIYLITAKHNIEEAKKFGNLYLRINSHNEGKYVEVSLNAWDYPPDGSNADFAIAIIAPPSIDFDYLYTPSELIATTQLVREKQIGIGDDIVTIGLHLSRAGTSRNLPIVRSGIIACVPHEDEPLFDKNGNPFQAYLAEIRSIGGLSGSPVFAMLGQGRISDDELEGKLHKGFLMGLIRGHYKRNYATIQSEFGIEEFNEGITMITPISEILNVLYGEEYVKSRKEFVTDERRRLAKLHTTEDSGFGKPLDTERLSQTDFTDALKLASRKIFEPDQETKET